VAILVFAGIRPEELMEQLNNPKEVDQ